MFFLAHSGGRPDDWFIVHRPFELEQVHSLLVPRQRRVLLVSPGNDLFAPTIGVVTSCERAHSDRWIVTADYSDSEDDYTHADLFVQVAGSNYLVEAVK
jgi:hypothetical protein